MITNIAEKIARQLFDDLSSSSDQCQRIEAKGGVWPNAETNLGGLCEQALAERIENILRKVL